MPITILGGSGPGAAYSISGTVKENNVPVSRTVRLYKRSDGSLQAETTSDPVTGEFSFSVADNTTEYYVIALDDDTGNTYNALIFDRIRGA